MKVIYTFFCLFLITSCAEIYFVEPQPRGVENLKEIPSDIRGEYFFPLNLRESKNNVIIKKDGFMEPDGTLEGLSDSLIFRRLGDYYVVNRLQGKDKDATVSGYWSVFLIKPNSIGNLELTPFSVLPENKDAYFNELKENYDALLLESNPFPWGEVEDLENEEDVEITEMGNEEDFEITEMEAGPKNYKYAVLKMNKKEFTDFIEKKNIPNPIILKNIKND